VRNALAGTEDWNADTPIDRRGGRDGGFAIADDFRDARMGRIHPANFALVNELTAKGLLGLDLDDPQRWG